MSSSVSVRLLLTQSDARLVAFARAGHERAFEALVQRYRRQLLGYCRRLLLSDERAEDALQQAFLQAWLGLHAGTEVAEVKPWLYRIVHNAALNMLRVSGYDYCTLHESLCGADAPQADLERRIAIREALAGLATLPQMQREALLRTAVQGHPHQRVARDLGLSETALRGLVYRARATLRATASAITPPQLVGWALQSGSGGAPALGRLGELGAGGGSAGLAGILMKGGAVALTASVLAGHFAGHHAHRLALDPDPVHAAPHEQQPASASPAPVAMLAERAKTEPVPSPPPPSFASAEHVRERSGHRPEHRRREPGSVLQSSGSPTRTPAPGESQSQGETGEGTTTPSPGVSPGGESIQQSRASGDGGEQGQPLAETFGGSSSHDGPPVGSSPTEPGSGSGETQNSSDGGSSNQGPSSPMLASEAPSEYQQSREEPSPPTDGQSRDGPGSGERQH